MNNGKWFVLLLAAVLLGMNLAGQSAGKYINEEGAENSEEIKIAYIHIDKNPPFSFIESNYGWYNHEVSTRLIAYDALSGIAAVSYIIDGSLPEVSYSRVTKINLSTEGIHKIEYFSMDNAGNHEQIKSSLVKLDFTAPAILIGSPASRNYLHSDIITLNFSGLDALSGISYLNALLDGTPVINSQELDMADLSVGTHEFRVATLDYAGNLAFQRVEFTVVSNMDSLIELNDRAIRNAWITSEETARNLTGKLYTARQMNDAGQKGKVNDILRSYIYEINSRTGKTITSEGASVLAAEAAYVYISNV